MSSEQTAKRQPSLLDASCDNFVHDLAELSPTDATAWGIDGFEGELQDFSPDYFEAVADRTRDMVADLDALDDTTDESDDEDDFDDVDYVTAAVLRDRLCLDLDLHHHGEDIRSLNNIASPVQTIRDSLLLMPQETQEDREAIRSRLSKVKGSLDGYRESLKEAASHGMVAPHRQISEVIVQCERLADADSMLEGLGLDPDSAEVKKAKEAFGEFSDWLSMICSRSPLIRTRWAASVTSVSPSFSSAIPWTWTRPMNGALTRCVTCAANRRRSRTSFMVRSARCALPCAS